MPLPQGNSEPEKYAAKASTPCESQAAISTGVHTWSYGAGAGGQDGGLYMELRAYLDVRVHDLAHLRGTRRRPRVAVEDRVQPMRRGHRRHVDEGVSLVELCSAQQTI